jgi:hypothetical protein
MLNPDRIFILHLKKESRFGSEDARGVRADFGTRVRVKRGHLFTVVSVPA